MSTKHVEWGPLMNLANEITSYSDNAIQAQLNKIKALRQQANWEGTAAEAAMEQYDKFITDMESLTKGIKAYGQFLSAAAEGYREQELRTAQAFSNNFYGK